MAYPLAEIKHNSRSVNTALTNNCYYVYVRHVADGKGWRITKVRNHSGQLQVYVLQLAVWLAVEPTDTLYQG